MDCRSLLWPQVPPTLADLIRPNPHPRGGEQKRRRTLPLFSVPIHNFFSFSASSHFLMIIHPSFILSIFLSLWFIIISPTGERGRASSSPLFPSFLSPSTWPSPSYLFFFSFLTIFFSISFLYYSNLSPPLSFSIFSSPFLFSRLYMPFFFLFFFNIPFPFLTLPLLLVSFLFQLCPSLIELCHLTIGGPTTTPPPMMIPSLFPAGGFTAFAAFAFSTVARERKE